MTEKKHRDFGLIFWIHIFYIAVIYASPFWLDWRLIPLGILALYLQWLFLGGCFLTIWEFGREGHRNFNWYYLNRIGFRVSLKRVALFTDYLIPASVFIFAFVWQYILGNTAWL